MSQTESGERAPFVHEVRTDQAELDAVVELRQRGRHPYQLFAPLSEEERAALKESIREHGVSVPVEVDETGNILDGHNRFELSAELGIPCPIVTRAGMNEEEKIRYVIELNCARRQLSQEQKKTLAERMLAADPEMADAWIGELVGIANKTVGRYRDAFEQQGKIPVVQKTRNRFGDERSRPEPREKKHPYIYAAAWENWHRMEALSYLRKMNDDQHRVALELFSGRMPGEVLPMMARLAAFSETDRLRLIELWNSGDERRRGLVRSKLAGVPPLPHPALSVLAGATDNCREAKKLIFNGGMKQWLDTIKADLDKLSRELQASVEEW